MHNNKATSTLDRVSFRVDMKNCPVQYERQQQATGTSRSNIARPEQWAERAWCLQNPNLHSRLNINCVSVGSSSRSYSFSFSSIRILIDTATKIQRGRRPIRYVKIHIQYRRGAASLRYRNRDRAEITVCMYVQKPYPVGFPSRRKSFPVV